MTIIQRKSTQKVPILASKSPNQKYTTSHINKQAITLHKSITKPKLISYKLPKT
jgi:hypothetical protein